MRTILAALTTTALLAIGAPANATDGYAVPTAEHVTSVEGRWSVGFRTYNDDGTTWLLGPARGVIVQQCGRGSDAARSCQAEWRAFFVRLCAVRDASGTPDYWPFPGPEPKP